MNDSASIPSGDPSVEAFLRAELARGDIALGSISPVLSHLLANHDQSLFSEEIVSRVRGTIEDIARQLTMPRGEPDENLDRARDNLTDSLLADDALVAHCHALAIEWQLTTRLETRSALDPVLSPLLQALVASDDPPTASTAMAALTAQARFIQSQRRMELPLGELPADILHQALSIWQTCGGGDLGCGRPSGVDAIRAGYDESAGRLGLFARLVTGMSAGAQAALSVGHAGVGLCLTALAAATQQSRERTILATNERQTVRLALLLRAAGLKKSAVREQLLHIHPDLPAAAEAALVGANRAAALLAEAGR